MDFRVSANTRAARARRGATMLLDMLCEATPPIIISKTPSDANEQLRLNTFKENSWRSEVART
eukprot:12378327-Alexandrium_andersonii.AAC.1